MIGQPVPITNCRKLGEGGMGVVCRGRTLLGRPWRQDPSCRHPRKGLSFAVAFCVRRAPSSPFASDTPPHD